MRCLWLGPFEKMAHFWQGSRCAHMTMIVQWVDRQPEKNYFYITKFYEKYQISVYQHIVHKNLRFLGEIYLALSLRQLPGILQKGSWVASQSIMLYPPYFFYFFPHTFLHIWPYFFIFLLIFSPFFSSDNFWITNNILAKVLSDFDKGVKSNNSEDITNYWVRRNLVFVAEIFPSQFLQLSTN